METGPPGTRLGSASHYRSKRSSSEIPSHVDQCSVRSVPETRNTRPTRKGFLQIYPHMYPVCTPHLPHMYPYLPHIYPDLPIFTPCLPIFTPCLPIFTPCLPHTYPIFTHIYPICTPYLLMVTHSYPIWSPKGQPRSC